MTTSYPAGLDSFTNPSASDTLATEVGTRTHSEFHADVNDAVEAIEAELGTDPSGGSATVKARIEAVETGYQAILIDPTAAALDAALDAADAAGGGTVLLRASAPLEVQGLPLYPGVYLRGVGFPTLTLPAGATQSMFIATEDNFDGGGLIGLHLNGASRGQNGIDFSAITTLYSFLVDDCLIENFTVGWRGSSSNDRFPVIRDSRFWTCTVGVWTEEHVIITGVDFRFCTTGLTGRLNDFYAFQCRFAYNAIGVKAASGETITGSGFFGCQWFKNTTIGLDLSNAGDTGNQVVGGYVIGNNNADIGIQLSSYNTVDGVNFGLGGSASAAGNAFVLIDGDRESIAVRNCYFWMYTDGLGIKITGTQLRGSSFTNNVVYCNAKPWFSMAVGVRNLIANNRIIVVSALASGAAVIDIVSGANVGNDIIGNWIGARSGTLATGAALKGELGSAIIANNRFSGLTTPLGTITNTPIFRSNFGAVTEANGVATVLNATTSIAVSHGLARTPSAKDISVTPTNNLGNATKFWVTSVGASTFTINVDVDPGATTATFAWAAEIR